MTDQNSAAPDRNSATEMQYRPEEVQRELDIKSTQYYERIKFLGIKACKDKTGKVYLDNSQFQKMKRLDFHIREAGTMEGFVDSESGELATVDQSNSLDPATQPVQEVPIAEDETQLNELFRAASEIAAQRLAMPQMIVGELSKRIGYEDLPADLKEKVDQVRENAIPKQNPAQIADQLLSRYRSQRLATA
ncbi:hypothetical protein [Phormidesmis sp. 146-33]